MRILASPPSVRVGAVAVVTALLGVGAVGAQAAPAPTAAPTGAPQVQAPVPDIAWSTCVGEGLEAFDCASVQVPTDYDEPRGDTTTIALTRLQATDPDGRVGSLFLNFGGPGIAGVGLMHTLGETFLDPKVHAKFDVIGFDPRGVGLSNPVTCFPNEAAEKANFADTPAFPTTRREVPGYLVDYGTAMVGCKLLSGDRFEHASSANVARDMDLLRQAVGDERLNYLGYSYGSIIGATYGKLFPERVRALAIDGTWDPPRWSGGQGSLGVRLGTGPAAEEAFEQFLALCDEAGPDACPLAALGDPAQVAEDVFRQLQEEPAEFPGPDGTTVEFGYDDLVAATFSSLYATSGWTDLAESFAQLDAMDDPAAAQRDGSDRKRAGTSLGDLLRRLGVIEDYATGIGPQTASLCVDGKHPLNAWDYPRQADKADEVTPHFGRYRAWVGIQCEFVQFRDDDAYKGPWQQEIDSPVLVIGTRYDPATPYAQTQPYADRFPDGRVLTVEGYGHTTLGVSTCADAAIARYLLDLEATDGATCGQDVPPFQATDPGSKEAGRLMLAPGGSRA
ncbi:alpha/beta fold hydrolase [Phycicoccus sp. BSK3Z-2]|uniref:Alpha/beta fold hydrolase n=1 Tax=Phycicoccus avicenniae TaxID=2828860 RepID=A0A941D6V3_9MICO|nr:alpha/beta hydrolase [Phycicoccus avicenniae]MBR7741870.1 alpha/beta fold hydrolase [Phycicoccus avicenniae]